MLYVCDIMNVLLRYLPICSGVARVPCTLGQEIFLRPLLTKPTEFEVKNRCKIAEEAKTEMYCGSYFVLF